MYRLIAYIICFLLFSQMEAKVLESPMVIVPMQHWNPLLNPNTSLNNPISILTTSIHGYDPSNNNWNENFIITDLKNKILLEINPYDGIPIDFDCEVEIDIKVIHFSFPDGNEVEKTYTLKVNYAKDAHTTFNKIDLVELEGGQEVIISIEDYRTSSLTSDQLDILKQKVQLKTYTSDTRFYKKEVFTDIDCSSITFQNNNAPEIKMTWPFLDFAEEYDIEFVYEEAYNQMTYSTSNTALSPFGNLSWSNEKDFHNNATRFTTKKNEIVIPLINEKSEYRVRIRPVGRQGKNFEHRYEHSWALEDCFVYPNQAHEEDKLNYQTIATYAEDAKYKIVNEYFDGRMASRQKVTALQSKFKNDNEYALVQESIYDGIGRKAIEVLPAPVQGGSIQFYPGFNVNEGGQPYTHVDFDTDLACPPTPPKMGTQSGASNYYSPTFYNGLDQIDQATELANIPDAFGYPFTHTVFMNDNTNRPISQGGVGKDHIVGSGHETKISYVNPTQSELDRLFGTEVGLAKYYKKVVTKDPNGQVSYAYQDLKGNVIATSLWGGTDNLEDLASYQEITFEDDLTVFTKIDAPNNRILIEYPFHVPETTKEYVFEYSFIPAVFEEVTCDLSSICYDCIYDIKISIHDTDCNVEKFSESTTHQGLSSIDQVCNPQEWTSQLNNINLNEGNHVIKVELIINEAAADLYVENYFSDPNNECVKHLEDFQNEWIAEIANIPCEYDCSESDGTDELCDTDLNRCEIAKKRMLLDLSPFGQYGGIDLEEGIGDGLTSVFSTNNILNGNYKDDEFSYPYTNSNGEVIDIDANTISLYDFVTIYWQEEWAEQFFDAGLHPEYCYWQKCSNASADYDLDLMNTISAADAITAGFISSNHNGTTILILENDPQFQSGNLLADFYLEMKNEIENYFTNYPPGFQPLSLYEQAISMLCQSQITAESFPDLNTTSPIPNCEQVISFTYSDPEIANELWTMYKGLYLSLKQKYEYQEMSRIAIQEGCYNECIGSDPFIEERNDFNESSADQNICGENISEFTDKQKVFPGPYDVPGLNDIDEEPIIDIYDYSNLDNIANAILQNVEGEIASLDCGLNGPMPVLPLNGTTTSSGRSCVTYQCFDELEGFFNQVINLTPPNQNPFTLSQVGIDLPTCFQQSPFLGHNWTGTVSDRGFLSYNINLSTSSQNDVCPITIQFPDVENELHANLIQAQLNSVIEITDFELLTTNLDQNGESNAFTANLIHESGNIKIRGIIACAKLGRCCQKGVLAAIEACLNISNNDNPETLEDNLWLGDANPYFDPLWIKNPCEVNDDEDDPEYPSLVCEPAVDCDPENYPGEGNHSICCCPAPISPGVIYEPNCHEDREEIALWNAQQAYDAYLEEEKKEIKSAYLKSCLAAVQTFNMRHESAEHHFVLSYYDQAGNLTRTVPPNGTFDYKNNIDLTFSSPTDLNSVAAARVNNIVYKPDYSTWDTRYTYNSLNQITTQNLPDHGSASLPNQTPVRDGISKFYYDELGRLALSQNPQQFEENKYSYTEYDDLGRINESGQFFYKPGFGSSFFQEGIFLNDVNTDYVEQFLNPSSPNLVTREQITHTYYDTGASSTIQNQFPEAQQENLRSRVAYAAYYETKENMQDEKPSSASYYDYDELGNVKSLIQFMDGGFSKLIEYDYDLVSGNVNKVFYQRGEKDQFIHQYNYDADNRITEVHSSLDNCIWDKEAKYFYYPHGPLARVELGDEEIQGMDYVYTIHGWIKGVNSVALEAERDAGKDGLLNTVNASFAPDEMGYMLNYYEGDYFSISGTQDFEPSYTGQAPGLYNGNIRNMSTANGEIIRQNQNSYGYISNDYGYDQLNRIKEMRPYDNFNPNSNSWGPVSPPGMAWENQPYYTNYSYDGNGNIFMLNRNGAADQTNMDKLTYSYQNNNRLTAVEDQVNSNNYPLNPNAPEAIHDFDSRPSNNYKYDLNGNLKEDIEEGLEMTWNVQGKVNKIMDNNGFPNGQGNIKNIEFCYDPLGNRIAKIVDGAATLYVRDAQGNLLSIYKKRIQPPDIITSVDNQPPVVWESAYIYGLDRVGEFKASKVISGKKKLADPIVANPEMEIIPVQPSPSTPDFPELIATGIDWSGIDFSILSDLIPTYVGTIGSLNETSLTSNSNQSSYALTAKTSNLKRGEKQYELTNHLGNVLTTVSDRKSINTSGGMQTLASEFTTAIDYFPGGMIQPERYFLIEDGRTRFKHQGQESDDEIAGTGTNYFYKYRMSDARLNRFWSVDPLNSKYPYNSNYAFSENTLTNAIELEGLEKELVNDNLDNSKYQANIPNPEALLNASSFDNDPDLSPEYGFSIGLGGLSIEMTNKDNKISYSNYGLSIGWSEKNNLEVGAGMSLPGGSIDLDFNTNNNTYTKYGLYGKIEITSSSYDVMSEKDILTGSSVLASTVIIPKGTKTKHVQYVGIYTPYIFGDKVIQVTTVVNNKVVSNKYIELFQIKAGVNIEGIIDVGIILDNISTNYEWKDANGKFTPLNK